MSFEVAVILLGVPAVFLSARFAYRVALAVFSDHWSIDSDDRPALLPAQSIDPAPSEPQTSASSADTRSSLAAARDDR